MTGHLIPCLSFTACRLLRHYIQFIIGLHCCQRFILRSRIRHIPANLLRPTKLNYHTLSRHSLIYQPISLTLESPFPERELRKDHIYSYTLLLLWNDTGLQSFGQHVLWLATGRFMVICPRAYELLNSNLRRIQCPHPLQKQRQRTVLVIDRTLAQTITSQRAGTLLAMILEGTCECFLRSPLAIPHHTLLYSY